MTPHEPDTGTTDDAAAATANGSTNAGAYVIERIVAHRREPDGSLRYRVRWYNYESSDDTWEPVSHLPRSHIIGFHRRHDLALPPNIDEAQVG